MKKDGLIFRNADAPKIEENRRYSGYGVVFNSDSVPLHIYDEKHGIVEVVERISPESLEETDMSGVLAARNHDFNQILARTDTAPGTDPTLTLQVDSTGIHYSFSVPNTTYGNDLLESTKRGDIYGSSFVFSLDWEEGYDIEERADGSLVATPKKIEKIYEMGPVTNPAYPSTTAENRSGLAEAVDKYLQRKEAAKKEERKEPQSKTETEINNNWLEIESL